MRNIICTGLVFAFVMAELSLTHATSKASAKS